MIHGCDPAFEFGLLCAGQWEVIGVEAILELGDQRQPLGRRQADDLVGGEYFHGFRIRERGMNDNR